MANQELGAWRQDSEAIASTPLSGRGSDADAPVFVRFQRAIMQLVVRREGHEDAEFDSRAAFVLPPREWFDHLPEGTVRQPFLYDGKRRLTGAIHFVNIGANGHSLAYSGDDGDLVDLLHQVDASAFPTIIYSPEKDQSILGFYPNGVADEGAVESWSVQDLQPSVDSITAVVESIYKGELITPAQSQNFNVWEDASKGWAHENAEARVQKAIQLGLLGAFRRCSIRPEQSGKDGRTDLEIVEDFEGVENHVVHHAVLEMKVLRQLGSGGSTYSAAFNQEHIDKGVNQAHTYGDGRNFRDRMLCCFDMREENEGAQHVMAPFASKAQELGVVLRYWFLYRSPEHFRACKVAQALS